jgi:hypothetical protein
VNPAGRRAATGGFGLGGARRTGANASDADHPKWRETTIITRSEGKAKRDRLMIMIYNARGGADAKIPADDLAAEAVAVEAAGSTTEGSGTPWSGTA